MASGPKLVIVQWLDTTSHDEWLSDLSDISPSMTVATSVGVLLWDRQDSVAIARTTSIPSGVEGTLVIPRSTIVRMVLLDLCEHLKAAKTLRRNAALEAIARRLREEAERRESINRLAEGVA